MGAGCMDKVKLFTFTFYLALVFSSEICEIFMSTFENTNSSVEHLRKGTRVKCYLETVDFVIISYHSHIFWEFLSNRWRFFYGSEVHLLLILFSKRKYESKKSINSQPDRSMRHIGTCVPHDIRDEWILQFSLPLADTIGTKRFDR